MADVPLNNARLLIQDEGPGGLESLLKASGLPPILFGAIRVAVNVVRESTRERKEHTRSQYRNMVVARILSQFETFALDDLDYLIDRLGDGYWRTS
jgi:hypothetical protein